MNPGAQNIRFLRPAWLAVGVLASIALAASAAHADDWGTPGLDATHSRFSTERSGAVFGDGRWSYTPSTGARALASPVEADGFAVSADLDGTVSAVHADSGQLAWQVSMGSAIQGTPALANGRVFVPMIGGTIVALGLGDGKQLWSTDLGGMNVSSPAVVSGDIIVGAGLPQQFVARLDGATGAIVWQTPPGMEEFSNTPPAVAGGVVVVGLTAATTTPSTQRPVCRAGTTAPMDRQHRVSVDRGGRVYLAGGKESDHVHAVDATTGTAIPGWPVSLPAPDPDLAGTAIYRRRAVSSFVAAGGLIALETRLDDALDTDDDGLPDHYLARIDCCARSDLPRDRLAAPPRARSLHRFERRSSFGACPTPASSEEVPFSVI